MVVFALVYLTFNFQYSLKHLTFYFWNEQQQKTGTPGEKIEMSANSLAIESLGIYAPIIFAPKADEAEYEKLLNSGVVHVPDTALPGEQGNCYIFGHSSDLFWHPGKYKTIFALLPQIKIGEKIVLTGNSGVKYTYQVLESASVNADRTDLLLVKDKQRKILTLQTSWPLGTALKRWIVVAELTSP